MLEENDLAILIGKVIEARKIPLRRPDRCWGGQGSGGDCAICGRRLSTTAPEYELEYNGNPGSVGSRHHVHIACLRAWEQRVRQSATTPAEQQGDANARTQRLRLSDDEGRILGSEASRPPQ